MNGTITSQSVDLHDLSGKHSLNSSSSGYHDNSSSLSEKAALMERQRRVSINTASRLRVGVLMVSWVSVFILCGLGVTTLVIAVTEDSSAAFAFALDALLDCISSLVVIWRYYTPNSIYSGKKERIACVALGLLFLVSAVGVIIHSSLSLKKRDKPDEGGLMWKLAALNGAVCLCLVIAKSYLARKLESISIATDAVNSGIGAVLAFSTLISTLAFEKDPSVWFIDPVIGLVCSLFLVAYGIWVIVYQLKFAEPSPCFEDED